MHLFKTVMSLAVASTVTVGTAQAVTITAQILPDPTTSPFTLVNFGSGAAPGLIPNGSNDFTTPGGIDISFTGNSGIYSGDVGGQTRSPFRLADGSAADTHYLNARKGGSVTLEFLSPQTSFWLLWGSVDPNPISYNSLVFSFSGGGGVQTVSGADVFAAVVGAVPAISNLSVQLDDLAAFDKLTVTSSKEAFEFSIADARTPPPPVPEPVMTVLVGMGLLGAGAAARRRR